MEILGSVAAKVVELTVEPIVRQVGYLLCYRNNFKELKYQVEELQTKNERIDHKVNAERRNGREIERDVLLWQESVIKTLEEAKLLCEDPRDVNAGCSKWSFPNLKSWHQRSRKAMKMANTIVEMKGKGNFDEGIAYTPHLDIIKNLPATRASDELESRNSVKEKIMLSLKDPKVRKIGVYGIGGVGKTTLVKEVAKQVKEDKLFHEVIIVTISQTSLEKIQDEIAEQLGLHLEEKTSSIGRANYLCERIKKEKTILIILDDLQEKIDVDKLGIPSLDTWGKIDSEKVGIPLKDDCKGCKLLLTSRSEDTLQLNDTQKNFSLQLLNVEESWSLFEALVGDAFKTDDFRKIATQVSQRCVGLPVLIVTTAKSLKYNDNIYYWKDTLNNLKGVDHNATLVSALEFNFNRLEDEVQKVFLLCGVIGTSIFFSDLLKYVIGLGVFKHINGIEDARNRLYRIIDDLKKSCLLIEDDAIMDGAKMHDIIHEVAKSFASKYAFSKINAKWKDWQRNDIPEGCTQIILRNCFIEKLPERLDCPHLTFLLISNRDNRTLEIPDSFFEGAGNLEALDLTGMIISSLPISFSLLTKLKTLCLYYCSLKDTSRIGALLNLEILSLVGSSMERFPSEIEQLTKLRMLDLSKSGIGTTLPNIWCKLIKIEELYMGDALIKWEVESSTKQKRNASLAKLGHLTSLTTLELQVHEAWLLPKDIPFHKLERYKVVIGEKWTWLGNKGTSRLLKVKLDTNIHWQQGIKTLITSVEDLYLDKIIGVSNVLFELNVKGFPLLKHLHVQNNGEIQHIINSAERNQTHNLFPMLETLLLHNLNNLVKICHGTIRENSFCKLKVLEVKNCDQLVYLFSVSMVKACSQIVEIQVSECNSMKRIVSIENADGGNSIGEKIEFIPLRSLTLQHLPTIDEFCSHELKANAPSSFFSAKVKFNNLETLKLSSVNLKNIWDDNQPYLIQNLANLTVEDCSGLKHLFSSSIVGRLSNLKQLEISKCDMMEEIIATEEISGAANGEVLFPKLETILIKDMKNLKTIWHLILASNSLACFNTLEVKNCEKIEKIFPEYMNGAFASLETLNVEDCKSVKEIFQLGVNIDHTTQLKYITLLHLPQLKQIWSRGSQSSLHFNNLQVVRVEGCGDLEYLFPFSVAKHLPQLEEITIKNAERMKEIVSEREEPLDHPFKFEFNQLTSIVLWNLQDLQGFCVGNHSLFCSPLKKLDVANCQKLKLFKKQDTSSQGRLSDVHLHVSIQQPLFTLEEVIDNLEHLHLNNEDASMIIQSLVPRDQFRKLNFLRLADLEDAQGTSPYWFLQNMSSLEWLVIERSPFKVIFPHQMPQDENGQIEIKTRLKTLTLCKLDELQHICQEGCQLDPVLDVLECLYVYYCSNLKHLVPSSVTFNHLTYLEVYNCNGLIYLMTSPTAQSMVKLTTLKIRECDLIERILEGDGRESNSEIEFNVLEALELESLPKLNSFSSSTCCLKLPLLEKLVIRQCPRMEAFTTSDTSSPLLREIITDEKDGKFLCDRDLNSTVNKIFQQMVAFCYMEHLELSQYRELQGDVWNTHVKHGIFGNLKNLVVHNCDFLSKVLLPSNLLKELSRLEELEVRGCDSLEALFELPNTNEGGLMEKVTIHLKRVKLFNLPKLKHIWNQNSQEIVGFENFGEIPSDNNQGMHTSQIQGFKETTKDGDIHNQPPTDSVAPLKQSWSREPQESHHVCNLEVVHVEGCHALEYLFPLSIATGLLQLEQITIKKGRKMKEIVSNKEESSECPPKFEFNHLSSLVLWSLPKLQVFYSKSHSLQCPSLKKLDVRDCLKWNLFNKHGTSGKGKVVDGNLQVSTEQLTFPLKEVICNLEHLVLNYEDASEIVQGQLSREQLCKLKCLVLSNFEDEQATFLYWFLQNVISLEELIVEGSSFKEIFQHDGQNGIQARIKLLTLNRLPELESICKEGCQIDPVLEFLESIDVTKCSNLKNLVPSSVTFNHLTCLEVQNCIGLINLITSSTARSLVNLTTMKISECDSVEEIVAEEGGESINEIVFIRLEVLELESLPKLKLFNSSNCFLKLPRLNKLEIKQCPRMKSFSASNTNAPRLHKIQTGKQHGKWYWEGDLNRTVDKIFQDKVAFSSFNDLELSKYPELEELWYGQVGQKTFYNLKHLVVRKCAFLSNVLFSSNLLQLLFTLEELEVAECDSLEAVFDVKALADKEIESKEVSRLKKLALSRLPNLKSIWNGEVGEIISYGNLQTVKVDKCQHLKNLFSVSLCQDLRQLEELHIESCGVEEIVPVEEGLQEFKFDFPQLTILELFNLTRLTNFYPKRYTLECSSLKQLNVRGCEELQIFAFDPLYAKPLREGDIDLKSIALFYIGKVPQKLKELPLNEKDTMMILNGNYEKNLFLSIKRLRLQEFQETPIKFLNILIKIFPAITTLQVRCSSFEALFPSEEMGHCCIESPTQIKKLWLFQLVQLEHLWNVDDDSASHPLVQNLEVLRIQECPRLIRLAPPSASFKSLTSLEVEDCNGLIYFMTSRTARSLVHLSSLQVINCGMLEEAVMTYEGESEEEISFQSLKYLKLNCLSSFKSFCSGKHTFIFPSLVTLKVKGCHKMQNFSSGVIIAPFLKFVAVENRKKRWIGDLNTTIKQLFMEKAIEGGVEGDNRESLNINKQNSASTSRALSSEEPVHGAKSKTDDTVYNSVTSIQEGHETTEGDFVQDAAMGSEETNEDNQTPFTEAVESTLTNASVQEKDTEEMDETIQTPLVQDAEAILFPASVHDIATGINLTHENIHKPFIHATENTWDVTIIQTKVVGTQGMYETRSTFSVHGIQNPSSLVHDTAIESSPSQAAEAVASSNQDEGMDEATEKSLIQTTQEAQSPATIHDIEESQDSEACPRDNSCNQSTTFVIGDKKQITGTQEMHDTIQTKQNTESFATTQNTEESHDSSIGTQRICDTVILNSTMIHDAAIDPSPSKAPEHAMTSILESDACSAYKWFIDISKQNLPHLEAGVKRHPQVLDWFNTKRRRRVFATLFTEVTRILRTTRLRDLKKDDRNYITECCTALEAVGFDASWLSYVNECIESCGDGDELKRRLEETEVKASTLRNELASVEASLALLRDEASRLDDFIES